MTKQLLTALALFILIYETRGDITKAVRIVFIYVHLIVNKRLRVIYVFITILVFQILHP